MLLSYMTDTPRCPKTQRVFKKKKVTVYVKEAFIEVIKMKHSND